MTFWERYIKNIKESLMVIGGLGVIVSMLTLSGMHLNVSKNIVVHSLVLLVYSPTLLVFDLIWAWISRDDHLT